MLNLRVSVQAVASEAAFYSVIGSGPDKWSPWKSPRLILQLGARGEVPPDVYANGTEAGCQTVGDPPPPTPCAAYHIALPYAVFNHDEGTDGPLPGSILLAAHGVSARALLLAGAKGWRLIELAPRLHYVRAESTAVGLGQGDANAEVFTGAQTTGATGGSIAIANPPCANGVGQLALAGGPASTPVPCPGRPAIASAAHGAHWILSGMAAGSSNSPFRLIVIDLPLVPNRSK